MKPISKRARDISYEATVSFEGGWTAVTGNFDGCGISLGPLQWNPKMGSLQPLLHKMLKNHRGTLVRLWGEGPVQEFERIFAGPLITQMAWANAISYGSNKYSVKEPWKTRLRQMLETVEFKEIAREKMEEVLNRAAQYATTEGFESIRALSFFFDLCTQNGSINGAQRAEIVRRQQARRRTLGRNLNARETLEEVAYGRMSFSRPQYQADALSRKLCIARGRSEPFTWQGTKHSGKVHGEVRDLEKQYGLSDGPWSDEAPRTFVMPQPEPPPVSFFQRLLNSIFG